MRFEARDLKPDLERVKAADLVAGRCYFRVGFIDEDDILRHAFGKPEKFNDPVSSAMHTNVPVVELTLGVAELVAMLESQPYAAVMGKDVFYGLITRADVLNYLRRQMTPLPAP